MAPSNTADETALGPYAGERQPPGPDALIVPVLTSKGTIVLMPIDRRILLRAGAAVALPLGMPGVERERLTQAIHAPERVDAEIVASCGGSWRRMAPPTTCMAGVT